jgi:hypothetical protein
LDALLAFAHLNGSPRNLGCQLTTFGDPCQRQHGWSMREQVRINSGIHRAFPLEMPPREHDCGPTNGARIRRAKMGYKTILAVLAALLVSACSGIPQRTSDQEQLERFQQYAGEPVSSVPYLGRYDSWRPLGRDNLVVWTGVNDAYLLTIAGPCFDLPFKQRIAIKSHGPTLSRGDSVIVGRGQRCMITEIRPVDYRKMKQDAKAKQQEETSNTSE